jgi:2-polyprenyl-6-hydroxyphenyl methylase/3-demethylubiquinone-9 3-methyltransferase
MGASGYSYEKAAASHTVAYLLPTVLEVLTHHAVSRLFELGCGNGSMANLLRQRGYEVVGVDPSHQGIVQANLHYPEIRLAVGSSEEDLAARFGFFPAVLSLEVVEHVFAPREFAKRIFDLLEPGGTAIISTPYHGYLKNLALALTGKMDSHFTALWDDGHIKFWSVKTLSALLSEAGFQNLQFHRVGRIPVLAKSMIAVARKP